MLTFIGRGITNRELPTVLQRLSVPFYFVLRAKVDEKTLNMTCHQHTQDTSTAMSIWSDSQGHHDLFGSSV